MPDFKFEAKSRQGDATVTRNSGFIPAVLYGKDFKNINIALEKVSFGHLLKEAGSSNLIDLNIEDESYKTLIHDIQLHPVSGEIVHIDFYKVDMKQKITTEIPLEFVGESILVIEQEGSFIANKDSIEVECLPTDLVDHIDVDISHLNNFEQNIKIADIKAPTGIEVLDDAEEVIALVQPPRSDEELAELEEEVKEDVEAVEVEHKGDETAEGEEKTDEKAESKEETPAPEKPVQEKTEK